MISLNMLNRYDILKSRIISISMLIFICSIIICSLSVLLGHQDCSDWDAIDEDCWRNDSFHNLYKIGFILGAITFLPALYKIFPKFWESMKPFYEKILEYSILICVVLVPITIIIMFLYPNCYGDEVDYNELCTESSLEYSLSIFIAFWSVSVITKETPQSKVPCLTCINTLFHPLANSTFRTS